MIRTHLVHGFNVSDGGAGTIDKLIPFLTSKDITPIQHDYGYLKLPGVLQKNNAIAKTIKPSLSSGDVAIGHSNGCAILVKALQQGATFNKLILINPALDKNFAFPGGVNEIHVFHNKHDNAVVMAKWLRKIVFWRNTFLWGEMGNTGYVGNDSRVINYELASGHSAVFSKRYLKKFARMVIRIIKRGGY